MNLIDFPEQNTVFAEDQPEYLPLPAHHYHDKQGRIAFCWSLSWRERLRVLMTGHVWHQVLTFDQPLQPQLLATEKPEMLSPVQIAAAKIMAKELADLPIEIMRSKMTKNHEEQT